MNEELICTIDEEEDTVDPNMTVHYMAVEADRKTLDAQAGRGWRVEEARTASRRPSFGFATRGRWSILTARARWSAGTVLVQTGARLQGSPRAESGVSLSEA
jgi:hypothetical protein